MVKKSFKESINPAETFISPESIAAAEAKAAATVQPSQAALTLWPADKTPPAGYVLLAETKSKRLHILIKPSLLAKIKLRAAKEGQSVNETIHAALEAAFTSEE